MIVIRDYLKMNKVLISKFKLEVRKQKPSNGFILIEFVNIFNLPICILVVVVTMDRRIILSVVGHNIPWQLVSN